MPRSDPQSTEQVPRLRLWLTPSLGGLVHSGLMLLASPPVSFWPAAIVAIWPLVWAGLRPHGRFWRDALMTAAGTLPVWAVTQRWAIDVAGPGYVPMIMILAAFAGAFVAVLGACRRRLPRVPMTLVVPVLWTGIEFFRGEIFFDGYPWGFACHPLIDALWLAAPAAVAGVYGVSLLLALIGGVAADVLWLRPRRVGRAAIGGVVVAAGVLAGNILTPRPDSSAPHIRIAALQTNVPQSNKISWTPAQELKDWERFTALQREFMATAPKPDLIVWPETMLPGVTLEPAALRELEDKGVYFKLQTPQGEKPLEATFFAGEVLALQRESGVPMLVGEEAVIGLNVVDTGKGLRFDRDRRYNSVYLLAEGRIAP